MASRSSGPGVTLEDWHSCRVRASGGGASRVACQPIHALNPYSNDWTIRAKLVSKAPLRHFDKAGQQQAVFGVEVVDDQVRLVPCMCNTDHR